MMKTGPNGARRAVWAISSYFLFSFAFFKILTNVLYLFRFYPLFESTRVATTTKTGPNDTRSVVLAISSTFSFFNVSLIILINVFNFI